MPVSRRQSATTWARSPRTSWHSETLTAMRGAGRPRSIQARTCSQAVRSTQVPMGTMRPISSARGTNSGGRHRAQLRRVPAQQRLRGGDPRVRALHQRLVVDARARRGRARCASWRVMARLRSVTRRDGLVVAADGAPALQRLGRGQLRLLDERLRGEPVGGRQGHADAGREHDLLVARRSSGRRRGRGARARWPRASSQPETPVSMAAKSPPPRRAAIVIEGPEAVARRTSSRAQPGHQPLRDLLQDGVRAGAAQAAVQDHEVLDVEERHRHLARLGRGHQRALQGAVEPVAVGQAGEGVEAVAAAALLARVFSAALRMRAISSRAPASAARRLREADEALGADGGHVPVERALEQVGGAGLERRARLALARSRGPAPGPRRRRRPAGARRRARGRARRTSARSVTTSAGRRRDRASRPGRAPGRRRHLEPSGGQPPGGALVRSRRRRRPRARCAALAGRRGPRRPASVSNIGIAACHGAPQRKCLPGKWLSVLAQRMPEPLDSASVSTGPALLRRDDGGRPERAVRPHLALGPDLRRSARARRWPGVRPRATARRWSTGTGPGRRWDRSSPPSPPTGTRSEKARRPTGRPCSRTRSWPVSTSAIARGDGATDAVQSRAARRGCRGSRRR